MGKSKRNINTARVGRIPCNTYIVIFITFTYCNFYYFYAIGQAYRQAMMAARPNGNMRMPDPEAIQARTLPFSPVWLFRGDGRGLGEHIDLFQQFDAFLGNVVANHLVAFRMQFLHIHEGGVIGRGAIGDDAGLD